VRRILIAFGKYVAFIGFALGIRKKVTLDNLARAYPDISESQRKAIAKKSYANLGVVFTEMLYLRFAKRKNITKHIAISNPNIFHQALDERKGLIVVAGHFANWEWLALGGSLRLGKNFSIVRKNIQKSFTERFLSDMRIRTGNSLIDAGNIRGMYRTLQTGGCIAMLADQAAPGESTRVQFFGREVPTFEGPARLALRTRAPMLFAECLRQDSGDYIINFYPVPYDDLSNNSTENIYELTLRHTHILEEIIRRHPDQWLWQHKRWKYA
jgi:KDO2-lipid IV(A) lauroyltransferase